MMAIKTYEFEGKMMTIAEIHAIVPAISKYCVRDYLNKGMKTKKEMLIYRPNFTANGRKGRAAFEKVANG